MNKKYLININKYKKTFFHEHEIFYIKIYFIMF